MKILVALFLLNILVVGIGQAQSSQWNDHLGTNDAWRLSFGLTNGMPEQVVYEILQRRGLKCGRTNSSRTNRIYFYGLTNGALEFFVKPKYPMPMNEWYSASGSMSNGFLYAVKITGWSIPSTNKP